MMYERFTPDARSVVVGATEHARRLGHRYVGGEHLLLAVVGTGQPAGTVLSAHGVTPERVEEEIIRRVGTGAGAGLFAGVDAEALAAIGIDLDAVRARIEASFGPQALTQAARALDRGAAGPGRSRRGWPPGWAGAPCGAATGVTGAGAGARHLVRGRRVPGCAAYRSSHCWSDNEF
jgi:hypothetical protein